jgi:hypothetical protein
VPYLCQAMLMGPLDTVVSQLNFDEANFSCKYSHLEANTA